MWPGKDKNPTGHVCVPRHNFQQGFAVRKLHTYTNMTDIDDRKCRKNRLEHHPGTGPRLNISRDYGETTKTARNKVTMSPDQVGYSPPKKERKENKTHRGTFAGHVSPFEEEEEGTGVASDVVKVEGEYPDTPGYLRGDRVRFGRRRSRIVGASPLCRSQKSPGTVHNDSPVSV